MKTEDLQGKGLNQEQIDFVMSEYGKELNAVKAERDGYKTQLDTAQASLKAMEGIDAAGLQTKVSDLTKQLQGKDAEIEKIKSDYAFDASVKEAIRKASGRNEKAIMALLDVDTLKASKNQTQDIEAAITALKKDNDCFSRQLFREWFLPLQESTMMHRLKKNRQTKHLEACSEKEYKECQ